jgi:hypothetical protein
LNEAAFAASSTHWGEDHRGTGQSRASVVAVRAQIEIQPGELPPEVSF